LYTAKRQPKGPAVLLFILVSLFLAACGTGVANSSWPGLSADGNMVYVAFGPQVRAYDIVEKSEKWAFPAEPSGSRQFYAAPAVGPNQVIIGDYGQSGGFLSPGVKVTISALANNGDSAPTVEWEDTGAAEDRIIAPPLQAGDRVYVGTADNHVLAFDAANGTQLWDFETDHGIWGQPTYRDGVLYVTSLDKEVYALDAATGEPIWHHLLTGAVAGQASLDTDLVYVGSFDREIQAVSRESGDLVWQAPANEAVWAAPVQSGDLVYYVDLNGNLYAVDSQNGEPVWSKSLNNFVVATPLVMDKTVYVALAGDPEVDPAARQGAVVALDALSGTELWNEPTPAPVNTQPVSAAEAVVVAMQASSAEARLMVFDPLTGDTIWDYAPAAE